MSGGKGSSAKAKLIERRQKALQYRKAGASYRAIACRVRDELDLPKYDESQAHRDVRAALDELVRLTRLDAEEYRQLELERLDLALKAIASQVQQGNLFAVDRWLRLSESRRKLLGLDAPLQIQVEEKIEAELQQFLDSLESALPPATFRQVLEAVAALRDRAIAAGQN